MPGEHRLSRVGAVSLTGLVIAGILFVAINTLFGGSVPGARVDLTEDRLFTLSEGTHETLAAIDEPIELHFFYSERLGRELPFYGGYSRRVRDLLNEIAAAAGGKVVLHERNPLPFSDDEDRAVSMGIQGIPVDQGGELVYFGLAGVNSVDDVELVPFFQPERENLLEYDLAQMIHALSNPEPTVVGVMSSLPVMGDMRAHMQGSVSIPWEIARHLRTFFDVINLPQSIDDLPGRIDVMVVIHPDPLSDRVQYELEQFLFRGGRAMLFLDPRSESNNRIGPDDISSSADSLSGLLEKWGVEIPDGKLMGDRSMAWRVNAGTHQRVIPADYVVWLAVSGEQMNQDDPVTSRLPLVNIASAGYIDRKKNSPLTLEPLITSTENSAPVDVDLVRGLNPDILGLLDKFKPDENKYVIAARLSGEVETAFPDGPPERVIKKTEEELSEDPDRPQLMTSEGPINLIVVADSDLIEDRFWIRKQQFFGREVAQPIASNANFVVNAVSNLGGSDELIGLRSRGVSQRPFDRVNELQQQAELKFRDKERELQDTLKELENKIAQLEGVETKTDASTGEIQVELSLTQEQKDELESLRLEMVSIRKQLRDVQRGLREDVENLETWLQFVNIGLVPLIVAAIAIVLGTVQVARRRRSYKGG
ncbi:MAG: Gldg family protein [Alphaproteobacteria bacterium]|nr:Gldg family protein [Alphaproteobacteria bacterium]